MKSLLLIALLAGLPPLAPAADAPEAAYTPPSSKEILGSTFVDWDALAFKATPAGRYCQVFDQPSRSFEKVEVHVTVLNPGCSPHPAHHHAWEEMMLIREGHVRMSINGKLIPAGPGDLVFVASHDVHGITNVGSSPATYLVINFVASSVHTVPDRPASEWAGKDRLASQVFACDRLAAGPVESGKHREIFDSSTVTLRRLETHITTLDPGASTKARNRDPSDELFVVKKGRLLVTLNGVSAMLSAGSFYYVAPNDERTMKNVGSAPASYQVLRFVSEASPARPQA
ncbi:MAG TPA: cupin domain-containing protein [Opitutaceae bacterium]|jgi:quercetin dioxygenase-like cupin family protein